MSNREAGLAEAQKIYSPEILFEAISQIPCDLKQKLFYELIQIAISQAKQSQTTVSGFPQSVNDIDKL